MEQNKQYRNGNKYSQLIFEKIVNAIQNKDFKFLLYINLSGSQIHLNVKHKPIKKENIGKTFVNFSQAKYPY